MKFIFPQNYKYKNKILGLIDYSTVIINIIIYAIVYFCVNLFFSRIKIKIFVFVLICFPCFLFSLLGNGHENIFSVFKYIIKYIKSNKLYLYK